MAELIRVPEHGPEREAAIRRWAEVMRAGGITAFATDTVWGLGARAGDAAAIERIFALKRREERRPMAVLVKDADAARALVGSWPPEAERVARQHWPGALTIVLRCGARYPTVQRGAETLGVRVPDRPAVLELISCIGPVAATSANESGQPELAGADAIMAAMGDKLDAVVDDGSVVGGLASTVLEWDGSGWRILRQGAVHLSERQER